MRKLTHAENTSALVNSHSAILTGMSKNIWEKSGTHQVMLNRIAQQQVIQVQYLTVYPNQVDLLSKYAP